MIDMHPNRDPKANELQGPPDESQLIRHQKKIFFKVSQTFLEVTLLNSFLVCVEPARDSDS